MLAPNAFLTDRGASGNRRFRFDPDVDDEGCTAKDICVTVV